MKRLLPFLGLLVGCQCENVRPAPTSSPTSYEVHFSPNGACESSTVRHIDQAKTSIFVQAYSFTSEPITFALIRAKSRKVDVKILLDKSNVHGNGSTLDVLRDNQVPTWIDHKHAIAHSKVMVYDRQTVQTGSFNFTHAAEHANAENCLFIQDEGLAQQYTANWETHRAHSE